MSCEDDMQANPKGPCGDTNAVRAPAASAEICPFPDARIYRMHPAMLAPKPGQVVITHDGERFVYADERALHREVLDHYEPAIVEERRAAVDAAVAEALAAERRAVAARERRVITIQWAILAGFGLAILAVACGL